MRRPGFRVRTLMVVVGVVAFLFWGVRMGSLSYDYDRRAREYGVQERGWREHAARGEWGPKFASECTQYYTQLVRKYRRARWLPWIPVAPDPHAPGYDLWVEQERRAKRIAPVPAGPGVHPSPNP